MPDREIQARFIEPMLLLRTENLPQGALWHYELKLDGFLPPGSALGQSLTVSSYPRHRPSIDGDALRDPAARQWGDDQAPLPCRNRRSTLLRRSRPVDLPFAVRIKST